MIALYRDPKGEYVFKKSTPDAGNVQLKSLNTDKSSNDTVARMRARVKELEEQVDKLRINVRKVNIAGIAIYDFEILFYSLVYQLQLRLLALKKKKNTICSDCDYVTVVTRSDG